MNRPENATMNDVLFPGIYFCIGLFIMANSLVIVIYFIYGSSESTKIFKPKDATDEVRKIKQDIAADKIHEKERQGNQGSKAAMEYYDNFKNYQVGEDDVMERWNSKYTQLFYRQRIKVFAVRLWFFIEVSRIFIQCMLVSLVAKNVAAQSIMILLVQAFFFAIAIIIRPYDNKPDNIILIMGSLWNVFISLCMCVLSIDEHKFNFLTPKTRTRVIDRFLMFSLFIMRQFLTLLIFGIRAGMKWKNLRFLFDKPPEEDWQKKNREADERKKAQEIAQKEKEAEEIEAEVTGKNKITKKKKPRTSSESSVSSDDPDESQANINESHSPKKDSKGIARQKNK